MSLENGKTVFDLSKILWKAFNLDGEKTRIKIAAGSTMHQMPEGTLDGVRFRIKYKYNEFMRLQVEDGHPETIMAMLPILCEIMGLPLAYYISEYYGKTGKKVLNVEWNENPEKTFQQLQKGTLFDDAKVLDLKPWGNTGLEKCVTKSVAIKRLNFYNFIENAISSVTGSKLEIEEIKCCKGISPNLDEKFAFKFDGYNYHVSSLITPTRTNVFFRKNQQEQLLDFTVKQTPSLLNPNLGVIDNPEYISIYSAITIIKQLTQEFPFLRIFLSFLQSLMHKSNMMLDLSEQQQALIIPYLKGVNTASMENEAQIYKVFGYQEESEKSIGQHTNK